MIDALSMLTAALCGVLAYHAHVTAKRLQTALDATTKRCDALEDGRALLLATSRSVEIRLHAIDRDVGQLCTREGVKRYGERG